MCRRPLTARVCSVVAIHNTVNERAWRQVLAWEALHDRRVRRQCRQGRDLSRPFSAAAPRLVRFVGRPQDFSPKARLLNLLGYKLPFDRHDWVVDREGRQVRYVIDFYNASPEEGSAVGMHLDVRPALDSPSALLDRLQMQLRWMRSQPPSQATPQSRSRPSPAAS